LSTFINSALALIVTLGLLIAFHEFGHYWVARRLGVKVLRFSIGFGKPLWSIRKGKDQTEYVLAAFPLGGYVKMLDEREGEVAENEKHRAFNCQPVMNRFAIVSAGPVFNFIFAILAFWLMYTIGVPGVKPVVGEVKPDSLAAMAGVRAGDQIISIDGEDTPTWSVARVTLLDNSLDNEKVSIQVKDQDSVIRTVDIPLEGISSEVKQKDLLGYMGISPYRPEIEAVIGQLEPGGPADIAGLKQNDRIISADDKLIKDWMDLVDFIRNHPGKMIRFKIERSGEVIYIPVTTEKREADGGFVGKIGAAPAQAGEYPESYLAEVKYSFFEAFRVATVKTWKLSVLTLRMIGKMIVGEVSVENLSGPITIATYAGYSASVGLTSFLYFLAIVSISLGVLNLLPVPLLDGGHLMYYLIEIVKGKPLSDEVQSYMQRFGIAILAMLMTLALYNDISRLVGN